MKTEQDKRDQEPWNLMLSFSILNGVVRKPPWECVIWEKFERNEGLSYEYVGQDWSIHNIHQVLMLWRRKILSTKVTRYVFFSSTEAHWFYVCNIPIIFMISLEILTCILNSKIYYLYYTHLHNRLLVKIF